jgi:hypothetical protein
VRLQLLRPKRLRHRSAKRPRCRNFFSDSSIPNPSLAQAAGDCRPHAPRGIFGTQTAL